MKPVELPSGMTLKDLVRERNDGDAEMHLKIDIAPIQEALEDLTPELDEGPVSRIRLINALIHKYGKGFKSVPAAQKALNHYDKEANMLKVIKNNRRLRHGR